MKRFASINPSSNKQRLLIMALLEVKGYIHAYREIVCFLLAGFVIGAVLWLGAEELTARDSLFEPFTLGVVDQDGTPELVFLFDFFNEHVIDLELMEKSEAMERIATGDIPAFVELPPYFTRDVFYGTNTPFTVHVNAGFPMQGMLVQLLSSGSIAYLSSSQAGVYATLGHAYSLGVSWGDVQSDLLIPVNMTFAQELIRHNDMFAREELSLLEGEAPEDYFIQRFAVFWHMLSLLALVQLLPWYPLGVMARFKFASIPPLTVLGIKWTGLFVMVVLLSIPIMPLIGVGRALLSSLFISAFGLLSGKLFKCTNARGMFIFFVALAMYFASGGIVPFVFLSQEMAPMRWLSLNYWIAVGF